ncbi:MAG TPA: protein phosphatase 2C domain-containing protein [Actinophytocola sp.]|uniref:protein phosphatase 2C domain-containing protein n=1 Tax=Actinophytocola sp. TaxID=1872138 RepID=UPI002DBCADD3|nr:protein phosphatase 2C domain-containing protein [Actinophytocola sp.]HEU5475969.1 protein phosphatase 2C domain-containing protein [Actinophytocola sp.]
MSEPSQHERKCPECAEMVGTGDRFCEGCGTDLLVHRTPVGGAPGPLGEACVACGNTELSADGYCERCGRSQPAARDRMECDLGVVAGVGDRGRHRSRNEDSMAFAWVGDPGSPRGVVAVVCDGVATTERADQASQAAADAALDVLTGALLDETDAAAVTAAAVDAAMATVTALAEQELPGSAPSCTFVSAVVTPERVTVGWVGDSRAYWLSDNGTGADDSRQLTVDDTVAAQLVAAGMDPAEAATVYHAHALSSWIGADAGDVTPHVVTLEPDGPGAVLLCSDGLWNYLPEAGELAGRRPAGSTPLAAAAELTGVALEMGGQDNITVVVIPHPLRSPGR